MTPPMMTKAEVSPENWLLYPSAHIISSFRAKRALTAAVAIPGKLLQTKNVLKCAKHIYKARTLNKNIKPTFLTENSGSTRFEPTIGGNRRMAYPDRPKNWDHDLKSWSPIFLKIGDTKTPPKSRWPAQLSGIEGDHLILVRESRRIRKS